MIVKSMCVCQITHRYPLSILKSLPKCSPRETYITWYHEKYRSRKHSLVDMSSNNYYKVWKEWYDIFIIIAENCCFSEDKVRAGISSEIFYI